ncbi:MAG: hypothetical protein IJN65_05620 [Clostridia bacterium]|nr:hypothetical protein [Clostridia bacterium]
MKRILTLVLAIAMILSLSACGNKEKAEKYCSSCGEGITKEAIYCEHCGVKVGNTKTESKIESLVSLLEGGDESTIIEHEEGERSGYVYSDEQVYIDISGD